MDNHETAGVFIAESRALLPRLRADLDTLAASRDPDQRATAARDFFQTATRFGDLCGSFLIADCAQVAHAFSAAFGELCARIDGSGALPTRLSDAVFLSAADLLTYLTARADAMARQSLTLSSTEAERVALERHLIAFGSAWNREMDARPALVTALLPDLHQTALLPDLYQTALLPDLHDLPDRGASAQAPASPISPWAPDHFGLPLAQPDAHGERPNRLIPSPSDAAAYAADSYPAASTSSPAQPSAPPTDGAPPPTLSEDDLATLRAFHATEFTAPPPAPMQRFNARDIAPQALAELNTIVPELRHLFLTDAAEDLQTLRAALLEFERHPAATLATISSILHKIKGAAATFGFDDFAELTVTIESFVKTLRSWQSIQPSLLTTPLHGVAQLLQLSLDAATRGVEQDPTLLTRAQALCNETLAQRPTAAPAMLTAPAASTQAAQAAALEADSHDTSVQDTGRLRVDVHRLDSLINHTQMLAINRAALAHTQRDIAAMQDELDRALARLAQLDTRITDLRPMELAARISQPLETTAPPAPSADRWPIRLSQRLFGRPDDERPTGPHTEPNIPLTPDQQEIWGGQGEPPEVERYTEFDHALRALNEVVADLSAANRALRAELTRLDQLNSEQSKLTHDIQRDVTHIRMAPLSVHSTRFRYTAQRLSLILGKPLDFTIRGESTAIDRAISDSLYQPLSQLLENAIIHGIEQPDERLAHGKPATGSVWMNAYYLGHEVIIEVGDDGRGVNPDRLIGVARAMNILDAPTASALTATEALDLIFYPGVSTFDFPDSPIAGAGYGLDTVRTDIEHLQGSVTVRSDLGHGTVFRVRTPISLSIVRALQVSAGGERYALPLSSIARTLQLHATEVLITSTPGGLTRRTRIERHTPGPVTASSAFAHTPFQYEEIPIFPLAELLGLEFTPRDPQKAIIIDLGRQRAGLLLDDILDEQEVVTQPLAPHLRRKIVHSATITPNGAALLLLDVPELIAGVLEKARPSQPPPARAPRSPRELAPRVLIVDDSVSMRSALERDLNRAGFETDLARDGFEALERMLAQPPRVVILDIEMPRLDGFELLGLLRNTPELHGVRVVMLTSRASARHEEYALALGAAAYLIKPCPPDILIETIRSLLTEQPAPPPGA